LARNPADMGAAQAPSSTLVTSPSPNPSPSPSPSPATTPVATEAVTIVTTVTGQVKTIISTPPAATADPTLGQGAVSSRGISKGTVVGVVVGVALGLGLLIGLVVWFCLKRRHANRSINSTTPFTSTYGHEETSTPSKSGIPSRQVSQMSSAGLLAGKGPRILTNGHGISNGPRSAEAPSGFSNDRRSLGTDQRLNPYALFAHDEARQSNLSLQDNQDYSRQLRVTHSHPTRVEDHANTLIDRSLTRTHKSNFLSGGAGGHGIFCLLLRAFRSLGRPPRLRDLTFGWRGQ
jgi:hypothetical protein